MQSSPISSEVIITSYFYLFSCFLSFGSGFRLEIPMERTNLYLKSKYECVTHKIYWSFIICTRMPYIHARIHESKLMYSRGRKKCVRNGENEEEKKVCSYEIFMQYLGFVYSTETIDSFMLQYASIVQLIKILPSPFQLLWNIFFHSCFFFVLTILNREFDYTISTIHSH